MEVIFADDDLERIERDPAFTAGFAPPIVRAFRLRMQIIRAASDTRDFYALKSLRYEKLKGKRSHQRSMRLNDRWRLILEHDKGAGANRIRVIGIEDYH